MYRDYDLSLVGELVDPEIPNHQVKPTILLLTISYVTLQNARGFGENEMLLDVFHQVVLCWYTSG